MTLQVHTALSEKALLPAEHLVDSGYVKASHIVASRKDGIDLVGPMRAPVNWQSRTQGAFTTAQFDIDWDEQKMTCPSGKTNSVWQKAEDAHGNPVIRVKFRSLMKKKHFIVTTEALSRLAEGKFGEDKYEGMIKAVITQISSELKKAAL